MVFLFYDIFFSVCELSDCSDEILQLCKLAKAELIDVIPTIPIESSNSSEQAQTILSTPTSKIEIDYGYYENITEAVNTPTPNMNNHFSILDLNEKDSIAVIVSLVIITFCIVVLLIALVLRLKKMNRSVNLAQQNTDIELERISASNVIYNPLVDAF